MRKIKLISICILFSCVLPLCANSDGIYLDCKDAPTEAITKIEHKQVSNWARVICTKLGHMIVPNDGYLWSYYGGLAPIAFYAQGTGKNGKLEEKGHEAYYSRITVKELNQEESKKVAIAASFNNRVEGEVPRVFSIRAHTPDGGTQTFYLQRFRKRLRGGMLCHKPFECDNELNLMPFFVYQRNEK